MNEEGKRHDSGEGEFSSQRRVTTAIEELLISLSKLEFRDTRIEKRQLQSPIARSACLMFTTNC